MQTDCWRHISTLSVNYIQGKPYYGYLNNVASGLDAHSSSYIVGYISPTFFDMVEVENCQLRDTRLNVQSPFCSPRISTSSFGILKD